MNSIINNSIRGDNPISNLTFYWKAFFSDGKIIEQFEENGTEHRFQEVKDSFDKLIKFSLINKDYSQCFLVDVRNGFIIHNNYNLKDMNLNQLEKKENIRLIHFRRIRKILTEQLQEVKRIVHYFLGFQYQDEKNNNHKIILEIDELGNWILEN